MDSANERSRYEIFQNVYAVSRKRGINYFKLVFRKVVDRDDERVVLRFRVSWRYRVEENAYSFCPCVAKCEKLKFCFLLEQNKFLSR